ncbi:TPA: hypothetical protein RHX51_003866 [Escherichia coli]|nr:hypothetical protein [Escherichia coli]HDV2557626.1 hypothetical protein [Escherichia coli]
MKTIKTIAAVVLAMFVGSANADVKLTPEAVNDYAKRTEVLFTPDDIQCTITAKMFVKGAAYALEMANKDRDASKDLFDLSYHARIDFPSHDMERGEIDENFMERRDQLRAAYRGSYIVMAYNVASAIAKGEDPGLGDLVNSYEAQREFYDKAFDSCLRQKENNPDVFKRHYAVGRIAEGDF